MSEPGHAIKLLGEISMSAWHRLRESFDEFERLQDRIVQNSAATDANWRKNLVQLRRDLQDSLVRIREALQACEVVGSDGEVFRRFTDALSTARSAIALHQAQWPAVAIDTDSANYRASVRELRVATNGFRETARNLIAVLKK